MTLDNSSKGTPWIGVDLDGTAAFYGGWSVDGRKIGDPVPAMAERMRRWLASGMEVRILTARAASVAPEREIDIPRIQDWTEKHLGRRLKVTAEKDFNMVALWDDRAIAVQPNTGVRISGVEEDDPLTIDEELDLAIEAQWPV